MKHIKIPKPITVADKPWPLVLYVIWLCDNDRRFAGNGSGIRRGNRIVQAFEDAGPDATVVPVETDDQAELKAAAENEPCQRLPGSPDYPLTRARSLEGYNDAIKNASSKPPAETSEPDTDGPEG